MHTNNSNHHCSLSNFSKEKSEERFHDSQNLNLEEKIWNVLGTFGISLLLHVVAPSMVRLSSLTCAPLHVTKRPGDRAYIVYIIL